MFSCFDTITCVTDGLTDRQTQRQTHAIIDIEYEYAIQSLCARSIVKISFGLIFGLSGTISSFYKGDPTATKAAQY